MSITNFDSLASRIARVKRVTHCGHVVGTEGNLLLVKGLNPFCAVGDMLKLSGSTGDQHGEIIGFREANAIVLPADGVLGFGQNAEVKLAQTAQICPDASWLGRIIDPFGAPLDGFPLTQGAEEYSLQAAPPLAANRKRLGRRIETGLAAFNTLLPLVRGQRIGLFAGSGVGKSTLLADLANGVEADVVVLALIGERGRELREFTEDILGPDGMSRAVVVAATSDQSALVRRRAAWASIAVAEFFRDHGAQVLFLCDSLTRFAEANNDVAQSTREHIPAFGLPSSTTQALMTLCERAGPGMDGAGDITAVFSVLVAGSDMEEPLADCVRGVLDGHVVLDRAIAERGRFPAVDILRSVSRSLPGAACDDENDWIAQARRSMGSYKDVELMLQAGLYTPGSNPEFDKAISERPRLEAFLTQKGLSVSKSFDLLRAALIEEGSGIPGTYSEQAKLKNTSEETGSPSVTSAFRV